MFEKLNVWMMSEYKKIMKTMLDMNLRSYRDSVIDGFYHDLDRAVNVLDVLKLQGEIELYFKTDKIIEVLNNNKMTIKSEIENDMDLVAQAVYRAENIFGTLKKEEKLLELLENIKGTLYKDEIEMNTLISLKKSLEDHLMELCDKIDLTERMSNENKDDENIIL